MTRFVLLLNVALLVPLASEASAGIDRCTVYSAYGYCLEWSAGRPGSPGGGGGGGSSEAPVCYWRALPDGFALDPAAYYDFGFAPPPEGLSVVWQEWYCGGVGQFRFRWVIAVTPENLAAMARGRLVGSLDAPVVQSSPPPGTASIVGVPVFVEVVNWTGVVSASECAGGLCVTVTATPSLVFRPGERGAPQVRCAGAGTRYSPSGSSPEEQAAGQGACAYAYRLRTGVDGRPSAWPGSVAVTWVVSWSATTGASGSLPSVTRTAAVPRPVEEVQSVVVGGATP